MSLADLVNIEMYVDNLKQFNQVWKEMLLSLDQRQEEMLEH